MQLEAWEGLSTGGHAHTSHPWENPFEGNLYYT